MAQNADDEQARREARGRNWQEAGKTSLIKWGGSTMREEKKKEQIVKSFVEMVKEKPLEQIRVQDIAERAGVSKSTFYRLFRDKYEVMSSMYLAEMDSIVEQLSDLKNWKEWSLLEMAHVRKNKVFYRNIVSYEGQNSFFDFLVWFYRRNEKRELQRKLDGETMSEKIQFAMEARSVMGAYSIIQWIKSDCAIEPVELIEYANECIPACIREFYE